MKTSVASQSSGNLSFLAQFYEEEDPKNNQLQIFLNGYINVIPEEYSKNDHTYKITFPENPTSAKRYFFRYSNNEKNYEYRFVYLTNYTMDVYCHNILNSSPLFINITYNTDLQRDINVAIKIGENDIRFLGQKIHQ